MHSLQRKLEPPKHRFLIARAAWGCTVLATLLSAGSAKGQRVSKLHTQTESAPAPSDARLLSDGDYLKLLNRIQEARPKWEQILKTIDPATDERVSYLLGKSILEKRDLALMETDSIRTFISKLEIRRSLSGELALEGFLESLSDLIGEEIDLESIAGITLSNVDQFEPQIGNFYAAIGNDVFARVAIMEGRPCATNP